MEAPERIQPRNLADYLEVMSKAVFQSQPSLSTPAGAAGLQSRPDRLSPQCTRRGNAASTTASSSAATLTSGPGSR
jgi:hypothetical protein